MGRTNGPWELSPLGYAEIGSYEGVCLRPYLDSGGVLTWGIGHTAVAGGIDPADLPADVDQSMAMVLATYRADMARVIASVNALVKVPLFQYEVDGLSSFQYNTGGLGRAVLLRRLNDGDYEGAAGGDNDGFMGWTRPPEIIGRRRKEQALFRDGTYSANGKALLFPVNARRQPVYRQGQEIDLAALLAA